MEKIAWRWQGIGGMMKALLAQSAGEKRVSGAVAPLNPLSAAGSFCLAAVRD